MIEQMAADQNIRIVWEKKEITHRKLIGSPGHVKRVMMNILSNAAKYNRKTDISILAAGRFHPNSQR